VSSIRAGATDPASIAHPLEDIATTVEDITNKVSDGMRALNNAALEKHADPVVRVLEECREGLLDVLEEAESGRGGDEDVRRRVPGLAFKIARATKVCTHPSITPCPRSL
jgi:hypothetical protein